MTALSDAATHASVARLIRAVLGRGDEPITHVAAASTGERLPTSTLTIERAGARFDLTVTQLPAKAPA